MRKGFGGATTVVAGGVEDEPLLATFTSAKTTATTITTPAIAAARRRMSRPGGTCRGGGPGFGGITPGRRSTMRGIPRGGVLRRERPPMSSTASAVRGRS